MIRLVCLILTTVFLQNINAQWGDEVPLNSGINEGYLWPRIVSTNPGVFVIWGNSATHEIHGTSVVDHQFNPSSILNKDAEPAFITNWASTEISAHKEKVAVVYKSDNAQTGSSYLAISEDGGETFSNPLEAIDGKDILHRFPAIHIDDSGLYLSFMRFEANFQDPQYALRHFEDITLSKFKDVDISEDVPGEVCDCCVSTITGNEDNVTVLFRNNDDNYRDIHAAVAKKTDLEFNLITDLNSETWQIFSCPSTGADALLSNDQLHSVFMSQHTGRQIVYFSSLDLAKDSLQVDRALLTSNSLDFQNFPRMAGNGDTIGVVMQGTVGRNQNVYFTYSTTGAAGLGGSVMLLSTSSEGTQINPDIAFQDGQFHMVWQDNRTSLVMYRTFNLSKLMTPTREHKALDLLVFPNPTRDELTIVDDNYSFILITDLHGNQLHVQQHSKTVDISFLESGLYILNAIGINGTISTTRFIKL